MKEQASPDDRCPFSRQFDADFDDCPVFEPTVSPTADSTGRQLLPVLTCRHLAIGSIAGGRFYPRCSLRWPQQIGA